MNPGNLDPIIANVVGGLLEGQRLVAAQRLQSPGLTPPQPMGCPNCEAAERQCDRMAQRINELERRETTEYDCRMVGRVAEMSGSHCSPDTPCLRCQVERLEREYADIAMIAHLQGYERAKDEIERLKAALDLESKARAESLSEVRDAIQAALGNGADQWAWQPGERWLDAAVRVIRQAREVA